MSSKYTECFNIFTCIHLADSLQGDFEMRKFSNTRDKSYRVINIRNAAILETKKVQMLCKQLKEK